MKKSKHPQEETHWESSSAWYDKIVGERGHYYHEQVILPRVVELMKGGSSVLDLACGQGVLSRYLPRGVHYLGVDGSPSLIASAKKLCLQRGHHFLVKDLSVPVTLPSKPFSHAACLLSVQNFSDPTSLFQTAHAHLIEGGLFILVMNHPCFRIPRQSSWGIDTPKKLQFRRVDRYMTPLKIPIQTHPGLGVERETLSFHYPLSFFVQKLTSVGFVITGMEEWCSNKKSVGKCAAMENRSRAEFPLFLALVTRRLA